jgi:hypothetical protein
MDLPELQSSIWNLHPNSKCYEIINISNSRDDTAISLILALYHSFNYFYRDLFGITYAKLNFNTM